jgi:hypothetical protein
MGVVLGILIFLFVGVVVCAIFDVTNGFGISSPYGRGKIGARWNSYTVQDNSWQQFWYDRAFAREAHLRSDAVQQRKAEREKAKADRVIENAKKKGWVE